MFQHRLIHIEPLNADVTNNTESTGDVINNGKCTAKHKSITNSILQTKVNTNVTDFIIFIVFMMWNV